jgi:RNA polymerase sigma factor (sigma-70 family)
MTGGQRTSLLSYLRARTAPEQTRQLSDSELLGRFTAARDEAAFAALVRRHGPMVLGVCQRVLHDSHDAEDAFQATFLVLARKAACVPWQGSVAGWLHQTAHHLALRARAAALRRRTHEGRARPAAPTDPLAEVTLREAQQALDAELARLPEKYRAPIVLCCLEGAARDEAAQRLGWPLQMLKSRLEQGRALLRKRLQRRGIALAVCLAGVTLAEGAAPAVAPALAEATGRRAVQFAAGQVGVASTQVLTLAQGALKTMTATRRTVLALVLLVAGLTAGGGGLLAVPAGGERPAEQTGRQAAVRERARPPALELLRRAPAPLAPRPRGPKAVNGLLLTLEAPPTHTSMRPDGSNIGNTRLNLYFKNVGKQPLKLDMSAVPFELGTRLTVKGPEAGSVRFEPVREQVPFLNPTAEEFRLLQPGESWRRGINFPADRLNNGHFHLLEPGTYRITVTYALLPATDSPFAAGSWTGTVVSNELALVVAPNISDVRGHGPVRGLCARLSLPQEKYAVGEPIRAAYAVTNVSKPELALWHSGFWPNHRIIVRDEAGAVVPLTAQGRRCRDAFSPAGKRDKNVAWKLPPGGEDGTQGGHDLTQLYDLTRPGRYTVQYVYEDRQAGGWQGRLPSNAVTFFVVRP